MSTPSEVAPHPEPLFRLELKAGGVLAPRSVDELREWVQKEVQFWSWADSVSNVNRGPLDQARANLHAARDFAQRAAGSADPEGYVEEVRRNLEQAYTRLALPHSSSPLGKEVEAMRLNSPATALGFLFPLLPEHRQHRWDSVAIDGWYGFVLGLFRAYGEPSGLQQLKGQRESFEEFLTESKKSEAERRDELDRIENDVAGALQRSAADVETRTIEFADFMKDKQREHEETLSAHTVQMEALRKTFREEMTLRGPVEYWESRRTHHADRSRTLTVVTVGALVGLAVLLALITFWAVHTSGNPYMPDPWRLVLVAFAGAVGVWGVRLVVRMLLSNMHLTTDAAERVTMVKTYLALLEGEKLPADEDRKLILQALFRPGSDGIVKDDGIPNPALEFLTRQR